MSFVSYTNAFGVYEDFYVRSYLTNYTASDIGCVYPRFSCHLIDEYPSRWIGGIQIFLVFSSGIFAGRLVDRGYLSVCKINTNWLILTVCHDSHHLMIAGAFMHSLASMPTSVHTADVKFECSPIHEKYSCYLFRIKINITR